MLSHHQTVLCLATSFYTMPPNPTVEFGGIIDSEIWKTIQTGIDSYRNVVPPLTNNGIPSTYYHGMMAFNFNTNNAPASTGIQT